MKTKYFKNWAIRFDQIPSKATFVILMIPSVVFSKYSQNCRYKYSIQLCWINWAIAVLWKQHSIEYEHG
jgi:hypothetical protein